MAVTSAVEPSPYIILFKMVLPVKQFFMHRRAKAKMNPARGEHVQQSMLTFTSQREDSPQSQQQIMMSIQD